MSAIHPMVRRGVGSGAASNYTAKKAKIVKTSRVELDVSEGEDSDDGKLNE